MALSNLLQQLTGLVSKAFALSAFVPILVFSFLTGLLLYIEVPAAHFWLGTQINHPTAYVVLIVVVGLAIAAYLLSSLNGFLREILEGRHLPSFQKRIFRSLQLARLSAYQSEREIARHNSGNLSDGDLTYMRHGLESASERGMSASKCKSNYKGSATARFIAKLDGDWAAGLPPTYEELMEAYNLLARALESNDVSIDDDLGYDRVRFYTMLDKASAAWASIEDYGLRKERVLFGDGYVAPTALGNVAASIQGYAKRTYGMDLTIFWPRLQPLIPKDSALLMSLQDAKIQLDFMVACFWMSFASWLGWLIALAWLGRGWPLFLGIACFGPLVCWLFYTLAVNSYIGFADLVKSAVDLNRMALLEALRVPLPKGLRQERETWKMLSSLASLSEPPELSYSPLGTGGTS